MKILHNYSRLEKPILYVIFAEFFVQLVNSTFLVFQPLYMDAEQFSKSEIANVTAMRYAGVLLFAIPMGVLIRKKKMKNLFMISTIANPVFALAIVFCIQYKLYSWLFLAQFLWGASFAFFQVPVIPFLLRNCSKENHTAGIALSYSTFSFAGIAGGLLVALMDGIDKNLFDERMVLIIISILGFAGVIMMSKVKINERIQSGVKEDRKQKIAYDWGLIAKALIPTLIIAVGAGLTIPFISLFFKDVHELDKGDFSIVSSLGAMLVAVAALLVPYLKSKVGYRTAIPSTQSVAVMSLVALATTQFYNQMSIAVTIAIICYLIRQPLMNMAGPMTTEVVMKYVGKKNREIVSALTSAIWSGSWFFSGIMFSILSDSGLDYVNIFLITALLYAFGVIWYYLLIIDYGRREAQGLIEED